MFVPNEKLQSLLLSSSKIKQEDLAKATKEAKKNKKSLVNILMSNKLLADDHLGQIIAESMWVPFVNLRKIDISKDALFTLPEVIALKQQVIVFDKNDSEVKVAMTDPENIEIIYDIEKKTWLKVVKYFATPSDIKEAVRRYHQEVKAEFSKIIPKKYQEENLVQNELSEELDTFNEDFSIIKIFDTVILYAYRQKASDVHLEARKKTVIIRYRIDGILHDVVTFPKSFHTPLVTRVKILSNLRIDETRSAQDGRFKTDLDNDEVAFRVSVLPTYFGEKIVIRLLTDTAESVGLVNSGLNKNDLAIITTNFQKPYGMLLTTGPTGSGKTTTLYSVLKLLNTREVNISTIEDPIEYGVEGINQVQVNNQTNLTFAQGLRSLLRQDPNIIMVGEIRDQETAGIAISSAMTGHLVLSTLHANTAAVSIPRLIDMGIEPFLLASALNAIIAQRLVRKICPRCIESQIYTLKELKEIHPAIDIEEEILKLLKHEKLNDNQKIVFYQGKGCNVCNNSGYKGRLGIYEVLEITNEVKTLIMKNATSEEIEKAAIEKGGMTTMISDGMYKALSGLTSLEELVRVTKS